eukprot:403335639
MSFAFKEQVAFCGIAFVNGIFIYPYLKRFYREMYSVKAYPTHYAFFDIEIDGKDAGRVNFELFGKEAPKTVNNFLAFASGDYSYYMKYTDNMFHKVVPGRFLLGGDFLHQDGTGAMTVYNNEETMEAEKNKLKFKEPYLLAASANKEGKVGSQFMVTLNPLPILNKSDHTIFGRMISGKETIDMIEGANSFKKYKAIAEKKEPEEIPDAKVYIRNSGVYKFEEKDSSLRKKTAAGVYDFNPQDFMESRRTKQSTTDVELNGFKITAVDDEYSQKNLIFLHGLLGQGRNWRSFALNDIISAKRNVYLVDLRNHGESDHHMSMNYREMADDVLRYADQKQIEKFSLLGHNIGAKTAMTLACMYPDRVNSLISIDTAPKSFLNDKQIVKSTIESIQKIKALNIEGKTRKTAMDVIQQTFKDPGIANFVASNLVYDESNERKFVKWCVDLDSILLNYENIIGFDDRLNPFEGPSLFLNGSLSVQHEEQTYKKLFPNCMIESIFISY